jgi:hypothetical protein
MTRLPLLALFLAAGCHRQTTWMNSGDRWRSWSPLQRETYVAGFINGHSIAVEQTCEALSDKGITPRDRCRDAGPRYSRMQLDGTVDGYAVPYTLAIDDFYKHTECRSMPFETLLEHLNDREYKSGEDLYKLVHTGKIEWGGFSIPDIDKCLSSSSLH